ncbi:MAG TPA: type II toxin-antitoxin system RelE/ParE family toxin [Pseudonocardiaceae bacterium]
MSSYHIRVQPGARKSLLNLDKPVRRRVQRAIDDLADCPRPQGVTALAGAPGTLRIRVGDYRVIYTVRDKQLLILVIDVDHRSRVYRQP